LRKRRAIRGEKERETTVPGADYLLEGPGAVLRGGRRNKTRKGGIKKA